MTSAEFCDGLSCDAAPVSEGRNDCLTTFGAITTRDAALFASHALPHALGLFGRVAGTALDPVSQPSVLSTGLSVCKAC